MVPKWWENWFDSCWDFKFIEGVWAGLVVIFIGKNFKIISIKI